MANSKTKIGNSLFKEFHIKNPNFDIVNFDFHDEKEVLKLALPNKNQTQSLEELKAYQRLLRVHPDTDVAVTLYENDMDSARKITSMSQSHFVQEFGLKLNGGANVAKQVYHNANTIKTQTMHLWANVNQLKKAPYYMGLSASPAPQEPTKKFENLSSYQEIFGSLNFCDCPECKSILGPAAYLVDLLRLIDKAITKANTTGSNSDIPRGLTFDERRPDISNIKLTCGNTNNLVPYLQIVNEILEETLIKPLCTIDVFKTLSGLHYPFNLPFNLPLSQIRTYLRKNQASLSSVFQTMNPDKSDVLRISAAREYLSISQEEFNNFKAQDSANLPAILTSNYGLTITVENLAGLNKVDNYTRQTGISLQQLHELLYQNLSLEEIFNVSGIYTPTINGDTITFTQNGTHISAIYNKGKGVVEGNLINKTVQGTWVETDGTVKKSGYCEFTFTMDCASFTGHWNSGLGKPWEPTTWGGTRKKGTDPVTGKPYLEPVGGIIPHNFFINKAFENENEYLSIHLNTTEPKKEYDEILNLDINSLDTLNRFIRISKKIGWTFSDLDWALLTVSSLSTPESRDINDASIKELAKIKKLEEEYSLPHDLLINLWYDIKTTGIGSGQFSQAPFDKIFNGPELVGSAVENFYRPKYPDTYTRFVNPLYLSKVESWDLKKMTAQATTGSVGDIIVSGIPASSDTVRRIAIAAFGDKSSIELTVENLSILYRHAMLAKALNRQVEEYLVLLKHLQITSKKEPNLIAPFLTPDQTLMIVETLNWVEALSLDAFTINYICHDITSSYVSMGYDPHNITSFTESLNSAIKDAFLKRSAFSGYGISPDTSIAIFEWLSSTSNKFVKSNGYVYNDKILKISDIPNTITLSSSKKFDLNSEQKTYIVSEVNKSRTNQHRLFITHLTSFFAEKQGLISPSVHQVQTLLENPDYLECFTAPSSNQAFIEEFINSVARFILLFKKLALNDTQINGIVEKPEAYNLSYKVDKERFTIKFEINNLSEIYIFTQLESCFDDQKNELVSYFSKVETKDYNASSELAKITGWDKGQLVFLIEYFLGKDKKCTSVYELERLNNVFTITKALGIDVFFMQQLSGMASWESAADNWSDYTKYSLTLLQSVKANSSSAAWPLIFKQINSALEEKKRDALLGLTIWEVGKTYEDITTADNLYEFLLIDVKRAGCEDISYIKEALNAAQLYLQRCRLNLELNVVIDKEDLPDIYWEWIMNYRIWEANREVFLYPENYIDPSLRKTKTDLFKTLENDLSQGNVTTNTVETAYTKYLDSFSALATLKYVDAYHCTVTNDLVGEKDSLFLFAKTQSKPYKFHYLSRDGVIWSQWHEINITINATTITPIYAFNKLFIFWVELSQNNEKAQDSDAQKSIITKASIKYSFYNFSGNWTQPQTLLADYVVDVKNPNDSLYGPFESSDFNPDILFWNKVAIMNIDPKNYSKSIGPNHVSEKLAVYYGPLINSTISAKNNPTTKGGPNFQNFVQTISEANLELQIIKDANSKGQVPLNHSIILNTELENSSIINDNEFLIFENNFQSDKESYPAFFSAISQFSNNLTISTAENSILNNYMEEVGGTSIPFKSPSNAVDSSFVNSKLGIDATMSTDIFNILKSSSVGLLDASGKVQALTLKTPTTLITSVCQLSKLEQGKYVRDTLFDLYYGTAVMFGNISPKNASIIPVKNQPGWFVFQNLSEAFLFEAYKSDEFKKTFDKLDEGTTISTPFGFATKSTFTDAGFDTELVNKIFPLLESPALGMVNDKGIVNLQIVNSVSPEQLKGYLQNLVTIIQATEVKEILIQSGKVALQYSSGQFGLDDNIHTLQFRALRITTSAIKELSRKLFSSGIDALLSLDSQQSPKNVLLPFENYLPGRQVTPPTLSSGNQVSFEGPYGNYYWELFFHGPVLVAEILNKNQQFKDAEKWLQYIFNPTVNMDKVSQASFVTTNIDKTLASSIYTLLESPALGLIKDGVVTNIILSITPVQLTEYLQDVDDYQGQEVYNALINNYVGSPLASYWQFNPFRNHTRESLVNQLTKSNEIHAYNIDPFDPHAIARLRIGAYEKTVVMKYIGNLIDWGDSEFRLYTWESITAALMLYIYAYDLLGSRPQSLGACKAEFPVDFKEILKKYSNKDGGIPQFLIDMENAISSSAVSLSNSKYGKDVPFNDIEAYFCVPENSTFVSNWDVVENRLYNIRHCLNINGIPEPLPLFQPPIDPMALVKAAASGNNVLDVATLVQPDIPPYRFRYMVEKAKNLTSTLTQLGNNLLAVLEKSDAEGLALLHATNEINILNLTTVIKQQQIQEQQDQLEALQQNLQSAKNRQAYYTQLIKVGLNGFEKADLLLRSEAIVPQSIAIGINGVSIAGYLAPSIFGFSDGGMKFGDAINAGAQISSITAEILNQTAGIVSTAGGYERRYEEWKFQKESAVYDVAQITKHIEANEISIAMAQQELTVHKKSIVQSQSVDSFLKSKFTNQDLYQWMVSRLSSLYFQTYNLAQSMALRAQSAYQFELDSSDQMITFNYWDDLHKGLLSGEALMMSIQQMESAYVQNNTRLLEIEKTVSIGQQFPEEFLKFKWGQNGGTQGNLDFTLSEKLFDFDFPSHYCRKIKSISISIPAVIGPYQNLNASLKQSSNMVLLSPNTDAVKYMISKTVPGAGTPPTEPSSSELRQNWVSDQSIAVSKGVADTGMFVLNFRDEQYLPFEGTGAISTWTLSLPPSTNKMNFDSISDVIINIKYTAKEGGDEFGSQVKSLYTQLPNATGDYMKAKTFDLNQAFSANWLQMFNAKPDGQSQQTISFPLTDNYWLTNMNNVKVKQLMIQFEVASNETVQGNDFIQLKVEAKNKLFDVVDNFASINAADLSTVGFGLDTSACTLVFDLNKAPESITKTDGDIKMLDATKLINMAVVVVYAEKPFS